MDDSRPRLPGQSEDHGENQQRNSRQSIGHADQLRRLQCRQPLFAAGDGSERRLGGAAKIRGPAGSEPEWLGPGSDPDVYGWTGAINTIDFLQTHIREFTADNNQLLGEYFGSKKQGWPFYNIPNPTNDPNAPRKIPSGANVFAQSPLKAVPSSYGNGQWQNDKYMLSSGGTQPIKAAIGWAGGTPDPPGQDILHLNILDPNEREKIAFLQVGYLVKGLPPDRRPQHPIPFKRAPRFSRSSIARREQ